jgi:RNA polymerase sigma-70 factor, ECF subfamily
MIAPLRLMRRPDDPEEELVLRAKAGSHAAFETLYRMHLGHVYGICLRILTDRSKAEEVTQKIFIHAWMKLQSFRGESRFSSWLYRLSVNMILDQLKLVGWKNDADIQNKQTEFTGALSFEPSHNLRLDLNHAIDSLPRQARIIFAMHDIAGYTHEEIAEALKLSPGTCKAQLSRARRILREALKP